MALKNLLIAFNGSESSEEALRIVLLMQKKYDAHVTGLLAHAGQRDKLSRQHWAPDSVRDALQNAVHEEEKRVEQRFLEIAGESIPKDKLHWISLYGEPNSTVAQYACLFDLTIVGRMDSLSEDGRVALHPGTITQLSGRPVLVVPRGIDNNSITRKAVLAWDGKRAATRALNDAMLVLETKQHVDILSIGEANVRKPLKDMDVCTALERHGISATRVRQSESQLPAGEAILAYCSEVNAGLLVIGAYEQSRFREELFGGVTTHILAKSKIPVLISH